MIVKLCKDCKHYQQRWFVSNGLKVYQFPNLCEAVVNLETGEATIVNRINGDCGKEGKLWEAK